MNFDPHIARSAIGRFCRGRGEVLVGGHMLFEVLFNEMR